MTELVFDAAGERYYETGASRAIFFPHTGGAYIWNGLVAVDINPQAGEVEEFWFDGAKTLERNKPLKFQATIRTVNTPREFDICEGTIPVVAGMKAHYNARTRFNLVWMTKIGNDEDENHAFKLHLIYNALTAPADRSFETVTDIATPEERSIQISAMPCGATPYYTLDSRDADLTTVVNTIYSGTLPSCFDIASLIGTPTPPTEEEECVNIITNLNNYNPGQPLDEDVVSGDTEVLIYGVTNNGLDIYDIPANGVYAANLSAATVVGSGAVLADNDDATYISSAEGDLGYTIKLPKLTGGYVPGAKFELHIRMSIDGGINPDDPDNMDAEAQVHIATTSDADDTTIGGFSDGAQEGMAFKLSDVEGNIVDYVIPLKMDSWINSNVEDVAAALQDEAYLTIVGASNFNPDTSLLPVEVRVYEASIQMLNSTDTERYLRARSDESVGWIETHVYESGTTDLEAAFTKYVDFKVLDIPVDTGYAGETIRVVSLPGDVPGRLEVDMDGEILYLKWYDQGSVVTPDVTVEIDYNTWYTARLYWSWESANLKVWARET